VSSAELIGIIETEIPNIKEEFDTLIYETRLAVIFAQMRINIADIAIQALEKQGFALNECGFEENNMLMPYYIS